MAAATAIIAGAVVASGIAGAAISSSAAKKAAGSQRQAAQTAAEAQVQAQEIATEEIRRQFDITQESLRPYQETGRLALQEIGRLMKPGGYFSEDFTFPLSAFEADPGYQFRLGEGMKALERSASGRGGVLSGRAGKEFERFGQRLGSEEFGQSYLRAFNEFTQNRGARFNRLAALAGIGQTAVGTGSQVGTNVAGGLADISLGTGSRLGDIALQAGNVRAAGIVGATSPWANVLSQLPGQAFGLWQFGRMGGFGGGGGRVAPPPVTSPGG